MTIQREKDNIHKRHIMKKDRNIVIALIRNIALAYIVLAVCRLLFVLVNYDMYATGLQTAPLWPILKGALRFDTAAVCYLNIPYIVALLLPLHIKEGAVMQKVERLLFVLCNGIGTIANLCDAVYVPFSGRRTTWSLFSEFSNEGNIATIIGYEVITHWYLVIAGIFIIWFLWYFYTPARNCNGILKYYISRVVLLAAVAPLIVFGIRGGIGRTVRPISLNDANEYIASPSQAAIVLNTPFSMIRTIGKNPFKEVNFFDEKEVSEIFDPILKYPDDSLLRKNVVVFIIESFGKEYIGAYNPHRGEQSLTPFLDSLISVSHTYAYSYGNGRKSIDGMPSVLSGIPMFVEPFFVTPASLNKVSGIAGELAKEGYHTAFFHGAPNGSMGFQAFAKATGFKEYYGKEEYDAKYIGNDDFDGAWAIWDEPFFKFYAETLGTLKEPFVASMFSASSHHPFAVPAEYTNVYKEGKIPIHKCIQYTDNALRGFFKRASREPWFKNTLFVITADHTNECYDQRYNTPSGAFEVPVIFYSPTAEEPFTPGVDSVRIAQQIDIMPTILDYLGYRHPFLSFGKSLLRIAPEESYAVNWVSGLYQYFKDEYMLTFDGTKAVSLTDIRRSPASQENLLDKRPEKAAMMERELKAIIQQYMARMLQDRLVPENDKQ